jgi:hypothetical protein
VGVVTEICGRASILSRSILCAGSEPLSVNSPFQLVSQSRHPVMVDDGVYWLIIRDGMKYHACRSEKPFKKLDEAHLG